MQYIYITASFYLTLVLLVLSGQTVHALPFFHTDDAGIVDAGHCQIELDQKYHGSQHGEANLSPACNVFNFELGIPLAVDDGEQSYALQVKKVVYAPEALPFAVAASVQWKPKQQQQAEHWQFNLPVSIFATEKIQFDANVGMNREQQDNQTTWGVASTYAFNHAHQMSLEFFKSDSHRARTQAIYQYHILPEQLSLFAAYGHPLTSDEKPWLGMGLSWVTPFR